MCIDVKPGLFYPCETAVHARMLLAEAGHPDIPVRCNPDPTVTELRWNKYEPSDEEDAAAKKAWEILNARAQ